MPYDLSSCVALIIAFSLSGDCYTLTTHKDTVFSWFFLFSSSVDHSRICLQLGTNNYINASLITVEEAQRNYILTQVRRRFTMLLWKWNNITCCCIWAVMILPYTKFRPALSLILHNNYCEHLQWKYCVNSERAGLASVVGKCGRIPVLWHFHIHTLHKLLLKQSSDSLIDTS